MHQIYKFPQSSLAELARNSVIQSGFEMQVKRHWLGNQWYLPGAAGNDIHKVRPSRPIPILILFNSYSLHSILNSTPPRLCVWLETQATTAVLEDRHGSVK